MRRFRASTMAAAEDTSFARLVSLAVHDLRTPLATVSGFAKTLTRMEDLADPLARYLGMIETASEQLAELLEELGVAARIEAGRYEPPRVEVDTLELAHAVAGRLAEDDVHVSGDGAPVSVDRESVERALYGLARCAIRHGGLERLEVRVADDELTLAPIAPEAAAIVMGEDLRDLGAAVAQRVIAANGGSVELTGEALRLRLPRESAGA